MGNTEILYDHYKETVHRSLQMQAKRGTLFILVSIFELINLAMLLFPSEVFSSVVSYVNYQLHISFGFGMNILQTSIWICVLYTLIRYFQTNIYIERQYGYISQIEGQLAIELNESLFKRESNVYQNNYPFVLDLIDFFYKWFIPLAFLIINLMKIVGEFLQQGVCINLLINVVICFMIVLLIIFYLVMFHSSKQKENIQ